MNLLFPVLTIVGGLVAACSYLATRQPEAGQVLQRLVPFQGAIGVALLASSSVWLLRVLPHASGLLKASPVSAVVTFATIGVSLLVGFLMGYGLVDRYVLSRNQSAQARGARALERLAAVQTPLGLAAAMLATSTFIV